jgi:hypothetical protein
LIKQNPNTMNTHLPLVLLRYKGRMQHQGFMRGHRSYLKVSLSGLLFEDQRREENIRKENRTEQNRT